MSDKSTDNKKKKFNKTLIKWIKNNQRDFYWRENRDAYKVFVAEFLLKRTTSTAAHREYLHFLEKYPNIQTLADADISELEKELEPIGLHKQRAKGVKEAAVYIMKNYNGKFPKTFEKLLKVPHIGNYTAACILSFGMNIPAPAIDSNGQRIISRFFRESIGDFSSSNKILAFSWGLVPRKEHVLFNYGLIDFGAIICTYRGCSKEKCPLHVDCDLFQSNTKYS